MLDADLLEPMSTVKGAKERLTSGSMQWRRNMISVRGAEPVA